MNTDLYCLVATCSKGTEQLVADELCAFGATEIEQIVGAVSWKGTLAAAYRSCLWSRFCSRILLQIAKFSINDDVTLFRDLAAIDWASHLDVTSTLAVDCVVAQGALKIHSGFAALKLKDVIVDQFRHRTGQRPSVDTSRPDVRVNLMIGKNQAVVAIDLSGDSLHRRGYRQKAAKAPLKENLGAALVALSDWLQQSPPVSLLDPMCGSGTLLIEAALMFGDSAPGLFRNYFGLLGWKQHDSQLWESLVEEALQREQDAESKIWPKILGYDSDPDVIRIARKNVKNAGLEDKIHIQQAELAELQTSDKKGVLLSNLPFGERLMEKDEVARLYNAVGHIVKKQCPGWQLAVLLSNAELTDSFALAWQEKYRFYNGPLACRFLVTTVPAANDDPFVWNIHRPLVKGPGQDFANRLYKNSKKIKSWAAKQGITCYRVYDRDLPEYNLAVDIYEKYIHVQEFAAPASIPPDIAAERFRQARAMIEEVFGVRRDRIFVKTRQRQRGKKQYQKKNSRTKMYPVQEGVCRYLVNFTDYLDTGLFLDHRPTRRRIYQEVAGKKFLNLFGYTGTATIQAAAGGASATVTVDLSKTYLQWMRLNLFLNGFDTIKNTTVCMDCLRWLEQNEETFDFIFVDPPTFSNTKKAKRVFDIQRDHYRLLVKAMGCLSQYGILIFSTNFKKFRLDSSLEKKYQVRDITKSSIPFDFERNKKTPRCWEFSHFQK